MHAKNELTEGREKYYLQKGEIILGLKPLDISSSGIL